MADTDQVDRQWSIVAGSFLALVVATGPLALYSFGVFLKPLEAEFGWSRASLSMVSGLAALLSALAVPPIGWMIDRWGIKRVMIPGITLLALSIAALGSVTSLLTFALFYGLIGIAGATHTPLGYVKSIASYFDRRRGLAIGIAVGGVGVGTALIPQVAQWLVSNVGWRLAYAGLGASLFVLAIPSVAFLVREPRRVGQASAIEISAALPGIEVREALSSRTFWSLACVGVLVASVATGSFVHAVPLLTDGGMAPEDAARALIGAGLASLGGRLLAGFLMDRIFAPYVGAVFFAPSILGLYLFGSAAMPLMGLALIGLAQGAQVALLGFLVSRYFGLKRFGQLYGYLFAGFSAAAGLGPVLMGTIYDVFGSYQLALLLFGGFMITAGTLMLRLGAFRYSATGTSDAT